MGHAASLLLKSDTLVKDVAYELGFDNPAIFPEVLKSLWSCSRKVFRTIRCINLMIEGRSYWELDISHEDCLVLFATFLFSFFLLVKK